MVSYGHNLNTYEGGMIDINNTRIIIPVFFSNKSLDVESMQEAFNECLNVLINEQEKVLKILN